MFYIIAIIAAIFAMPAKAQGVDPLIGTWKLNLEKSTFTGAAIAPKSRTATWTGEGQNFAVTAEGVEAPTASHSKSYSGISTMDKLTR
jgi:hypothetical protein